MLYNPRISVHDIQEIQHLTFDITAKEMMSNDDSEFTVETSLPEFASQHLGVQHM